MKIPFLNFEPMHGPIKQEMQEAFTEVYEASWFILGERTKKFEQQYAEFNKVKYCIGVSNGLDALLLSLKALGIGTGDEVLIPSNTYIATALAISYVGATPVLVEPNPDTFNMDLAYIEAAITSRTKVIMPVHLYGQCSEMREIMELAGKNSLQVIEDNAQSQGSSHHGKPAGSFGQVNGTSFYPGKNLGALGDAGAVTTNDEKLAQDVRIRRNYGSQKKYFNEMQGYNMRLDELQSALLSVKMKYLTAWTSQRQQIASWYDEALKGIGDIITPAIATGATHVYHLYVIRTEKRDGLQTHLEKNGIGTLIHYPLPLHLQEAYRHLGMKKGDYPIAEKMADTVLSIPLWPGMTQSQVQLVADTIQSYF